MPRGYVRSLAWVKLFSSDLSAQTHLEVIYKNAELCQFSTPTTVYISVLELLSDSSYSMQTFQSL